MIGAEVLFNFADGSFWHRHVSVRFPPTGADRRARAWRGSEIEQPQGRGPT